MKKIIYVLIPLISVISFSEEKKAVSRKTEIKNELNDYFKATGINNNDEVGKGDYNNFSPDKFKTDINNFSKIIDSKTEMIFNVADKVAMGLSTSLSVLGSIPTVFGTGAPGAAAAADNITNMMNKINNVKARLDTLKEYKRKLQSMNPFDPNVLKMLDKMSLTVEEARKETNEIASFAKKTKDQAKKVQTKPVIKKSEDYEIHKNIEEKNLVLIEDLYDKIGGPSFNKKMEEFSKKVNEANKLKTGQYNQNTKIYEKMIAQNNAIIKGIELLIRQKEYQAQIDKHKYQVENANIIRNININQSDMKFLEDKFEETNSTNPLKNLNKGFIELK